MLYKNSIKNGYNQVMISLEVPKDDIMYNLLCLHSNDTKFSKYPFINHDRIRKGLLNEEEERYLLEEVEPDLRQNMSKMVILDETDFKTFTFGEITARLEEVDDKTPGGIDVIYWDHANLFKFSGGQQRNSSTGEIINAYISFIRRLSIRFRRDKENPNEWRKLVNVVLAQSEPNRMAEGGQEYREVHPHSNLRSQRDGKSQLLHHSPIHVRRHEDLQRGERSAPKVEIRPNRIRTHQHICGP